MKFRKISENKIVVTLSRTELASRDLDVKLLKNNSVAYQKFFWDVVEQAQEELGFDVQGSQLMVETKSDKDGNLMITITKAGEQEVERGLERLFSELMQEAGLLPDWMHNEDVVSERKQEAIRYDTFRFTDFEALLGFARSISEDFSLVNRLYCYEDAYYLLVRSGPKKKKLADDLIDIAMEFNGEPLEAALWMPLLEERGKKLIKVRAVQTLTEKFS